MGKQFLFCVALLFALNGSNQAFAQNPNGLMNMFTAIMGAAIVNNARIEWSKIPPNETACIEQGLREQGVSIGGLIQNGIVPNDPRVSGIRFDCRTAALSPSNTGPTNSNSADIEELSKKPNFDCSRARSLTTRTVCLDQTGASADWDLITAYWARYFSLPESERQAFDQGQQDWLDLLNQKCQRAQSPQQCVLAAYHKRAALYRSQLTGDALAESRLTPEQHAQIRQALAALGLLNGIPDGEFGYVTRAAIRQFKVHSGAAEGEFLTAEERSHLLQGTLGGQTACHVMDPTGTPLNVRDKPNGAAVDTLTNGTPIRVLGIQQDTRGRDWALITGPGEREAIGWAFRDYIACGPTVAGINPPPSGRTPAPHPKDTPQLKDARAFLGDARKFIASQQTVPSISEVANQAAAIQIALDNFDDAAATKSRQKLADLLNAIPGFKEFERDQQDARKKQADQELAEAKKQGTKNIFFIDYYLKRHLGDPSTGSFNSLRSHVDASVTNNTIDEIADANNAVEAYVQKNGLSDAYREASERFDNQTRGTAPDLGFGAKSQFVLDGADDDIVLLYNSSKTAPSVWQNVGGEVVFQNNSASVCSAQQGNPDAAMLRYIERKLRGNGAANLTSVPSPCDLSRVAGSIDIVAFQRRGFLDGPTDYNRTLVKMIEDGTLRKYQIVTDYPKVLADRLAFSRQLENDVENDERKGFGVITVIGSSSVCVVAQQNSDTIDGIKELLSKNRDLIAPKLSAEWEFADASTADIAFLNLQRQYCGYVAAGVADLRLIMQALQRENKPFKFAAIWWSEQNIKQAADDAHERIRKIDKGIKDNIDAGVFNTLSADAKQRALRAKYGGEARSLLNPLRDHIKSLTENRPLENGELFSSYSSWLKGRADQQWETNSVNYQIEDFGTVKWENRTLDAIVIRARIDQMNSILGKYDHQCFDFGAINDSEFHIWRDPVAVDCNNDSNIRNWEIRQGFQSEWNVQGAQLNDE